MFSELTVVIPTYKRQEYIRRQIKYWEKTGVKLIILDGSPKACRMESLDLSVAMQYFHIPKSIESRFNFAVNLIQTKYAVLLGDDEFLTLSGVKECLAFLSANQDFVSCKGAALGFSYEDKKVTGLNVYPELRDINSLTDEHPKDRMLRHMMPYAMTTLWAIMRADVFKASLTCMGGDQKFKTACAGEFQTSLLVSYFGKCKILNSLVWLRSAENKSIWWEEGLMSMEDWYFENEGTAEADRFFGNIELQLTISARDDARQWMLSAIRGYASCSSQSRVNKRSRLRYLLKKAIPVKVIEWLRLQRYRHGDTTRLLGFKSKNQLVSLKDAAILLNNDSVSVNFTELEALEFFIQNFYSELDIQGSPNCFAS